MDDLFSDLSSISDCDDECLLHLSAKKSKRLVISTTIPHVVMAVPPIYKLEEIDFKRRQITLEEKNCETEVKWEERADKWVQTDDIPMESGECLADLPPTYREATYTESALERVLRHMSAHLHRAQLQQWLAEKPQRNASFHIKPVQTNTIYRGVYNKEKNVFILLLSENNRYFIELRSLKNLLKSVKYDVPLKFFKETEKVHLFSSQDYVAIFSSSKVFVLKIESLESSSSFESFITSHDVVSLLVLDGHLCYINSAGIVTKLRENSKILESSPLFNPILSCCVISNRIYVVCPKSVSSFSRDSPLDYESYESEMVLTKGIVKKFGDKRLLMFDKTSQTCFIWETDKPKSPSHLLSFNSSEYTVDITCDSENLYSLTSAGVVSVWKLRPNGRKYRDHLFKTYLSHCSKLLLVHPRKFTLLTASEVHFVVFGSADSEQ